MQTSGAGVPDHIVRFSLNDRRHFIGSLDARIIMGHHKGALSRLWYEKRGEGEAEDLSDNLIVQLGTETEVLNRAGYQRSSGLAIKDPQKRVQHPIHKWMAATLDGAVEQTGAASKQNSCSLAHSQKRLQPTSIWLSCSTMCG